MDQEVGTYKVCCIIPARLGSSRFPGKPLAKINNKELILRVCDIASKCKLIDKVVVATEDTEIFNLVSEYGCESIITSKHNTCTHRVSEVSKILDYDFYVNLQGDEPCIDPEWIDSMIQFAIDNHCQMVQGTYPISKQDIEDEDCVKAIVNNGSIIYLTRVPEVKTDNLIGISGLYVYDKKTIQEFNKYDLRMVDYWKGLDTLGFIGKVDVIPFMLPHRTYAIDRPSDIQIVEDFLNSNEIHC